MPTEQEILQRAKQLIIAKNYQQARQMLLTISHHATAQKWLTKLDEIAPIEPTFASDIRFPSSDINRDTSSQQPKTKHPISNINPWNPSTGFMFLFFFAPAVLIFFPLNWRRLGKPEWALETFLIGVLTFGALISGLLIEAVKLDSDSSLGIGLIIVSMAANTGFWTSVGSLQADAYKKWIKARDPVTLVNHSYNFTRAVLTTVGLMIFGIVVGVYFVNQNQKMTTFEDELLTVEYRGSLWEKGTPDDIEFCRPQPESCMLILGQKPFEQTIIVISAYPINPAFGIESLDTTWWQQVQAAYPYEINPPVYEPIEFGGLTGFVREFAAPEDDEYFYYRIINVIHEDHFVQIQAWSPSPASFDEARDEIMKVIDTVSFKKS